MSQINSVSTSERASFLGGGNEDTVEEKDPLGRDAFLTMLVAQLKHQDPLNPMEGTDFTSQLAQFTSLEQMFNMNDSLQEIAGSFVSDNKESLLDYIGKDVEGTALDMDLKDGEVMGGHYTIEKPGEILISVYDAAGVKVKTIYHGQVEEGTHKINWDGKDGQGNLLQDGFYSYEVLSKGEKGGYRQVESLITGRVTGIINKSDAGYLIVGDQIINQKNITKVLAPEENLSVTD